MHDTTFQDQPDTPAHVFAARAFKYRLWGTPKPTAKAPPPARTTNQPTTERPRITQSKSDDTITSPSKPNGILLTPGTTNLRRSKTVTFPPHFQDERDWKDSGLHKRKSDVIVPGKFRSPTKIDLAVVEDTSTKPRSLFSERLEGARTKTPAGSTSTNQKGATGELTNKVTETLASSSDQEDWKQRYEQYTARTEREMRKLIAKQQAAKHYAREKDTKATTLAEQLRVERKKVAKLEASVNELSAQVATLKAQLSKPGIVKTLEERFSAIRTRSPARPAQATIEKPSRRPRTQDNEEDIWAAALSPQTPPARRARIIAADQSPLAPRSTNAESHTPKQTPPPNKLRGSVPPAIDVDMSLDLPQPSPEAQAYTKNITPRRRSTPSRHVYKESVVMRHEEKENAPPVHGMSTNGGTDSPRKALDAERRAKAAARIAARRMERQRGKTKIDGL
ncbi:hypothetical protein ANO11243_047640 [Dothideomycetidae sp. 11243]|nr:hypothetical protein ANO11243_047640 [fungal sp. No.11243]